MYMCDSVMVKCVYLLNSKGELDVNLRMLFLDLCYKDTEQSKVSVSATARPKVL